MNIVDELRQNETRVFDRLVDGELSQAQRRELLSALDDEPGAWRRCALAFLEAQTWRWQLARIANEPLAAPVTLPAVPASSRTSSRHASFLAACVTIAASLLMAFGLGMKYQLSTTEIGPAGEIAKVAVPAPSKVVESQGAARESDERPFVAPLADENMITLAVSTGDEAAQEIRLPVSAAAEGDTTWSQTASAVNPELLQSFERAGLAVRRQQNFMPIDLSDGRQLIVPFEEIEIHDPQNDVY